MSHLHKRNTFGFTLIELLVVIAIIGVLASIVLASLNNARRKSRDARRVTDIKQIQLALELYFDGQSNTYPASSITCNATTNYGLEDLKTKGYIPQVPRDPLSNGANNCYNYATSGSSPFTTYHLGGTLEDIGSSALTGDSDFNSSGWTNACHGLSNAASPPCGITAGTAQPGGTETCYDVRP
jgi:type II secretion system protein G